MTQRNQAATQMFGWTKEEVLGRELPYVCIGHEEESDSLWMSVLRGKPAENMELRRVKKDGTLFGVSFSGVGLHDPKGLLTGSFEFFTDITERKRLENEVQTHRDRLAFLISSIPSVIYSAQTTGTYGATFSQPMSRRSWVIGQTSLGPMRRPGPTGSIRTTRLAWLPISRNYLRTGLTRMNIDFASRMGPIGGCEATSGWCTMLRENRSRWSVPGLTSVEDHDAGRSLVV